MIRRVRALIVAATLPLVTVASSVVAQTAPTVSGPPAMAPQNPSPMVETTRAHQRLTQRALGGTTRSFTGPAGKPVSVWIPDRSPADFALVVHFHGADWVAQQAVASLKQRTVAAVVNVGSGSGSYDRAFSDSAVFDSLRTSITREVTAVTGKPARVAQLTLSGFSAGHGAIRAILRTPRHADAVRAILLLDGMHTSYVPEGRPMALDGTLDTTNLIAFRDFARAAMRGEKRFVVTHSEIFPGTFASTTETADWLLQSLALPRTPVLKWGPRGLQQLSEVHSGRFLVFGFAGNSAPDHIDQFHAMPELLTRLLR